MANKLRFDQPKSFPFVACSKNSPSGLYFAKDWSVTRSINLFYDFERLTDWVSTMRMKTGIVAIILLVLTVVIVTVISRNLDDSTNDEVKPGVVEVATDKVPLPKVEDAVAASDATRIVAATVNDQSISVALADYHFRRFKPAKPLDEEGTNRLRAFALGQCVQNEIMLQAIIKRQGVLDEEELQVALKRHAEELASKGESVGELLTRENLTEEEYKREILFAESWKVYIAKTTPDDKLKLLFNRRKAEFDGTQRRVAHIMLTASDELDWNDRERIRIRLGEIRGKIVFGELTFEEASAKYSEAPEANLGGDIGFIGRWGPMPEDFSRAAFSLDIGTISGPEWNRGGLSLIKVLDIKPGDQSWEQAKPQLLKHAHVQTMRYMLETESVRADTRFTGAYPYINPKNGKLALPTDKLDSTPGEIMTEGRFKVRMPKHATIQEVRYKFPNGESKMAYLDNIIGTKKYHFSVTTYPPRTFATVEPQALLGEQRDLIVGSTGLAGEQTPVRLVSSKHISVKGRPAIEFVSESKNRRAKYDGSGVEEALTVRYVRLVLVDDQLVKLYIDAPPGDVSADDASQFWNTFEISE